MTSTTDSSLSLEKGPLGIPLAPFASDVLDLLSLPPYGGGTIDSTMFKLKELLMKYQVMEQNLLRQRQSVEMAKQEMDRSIDAVRMITNSDSDDNENIRSKEGVTECSYEFECADTLLCSAIITDTSKVGIMLEKDKAVYLSPSEALTFIKKRLGEFEIQAQQIEEALYFLREQVTTMEVNMARLHNLRVEQGRTK